MSDYGTITDYQTCKPIRQATEAEWRRSMDSARANPFDGVFEDEDGTAVYVDGGPESPYTVLVGDTYETPADAAQYAAAEDDALRMLGSDEEAAVRAIEQDHERSREAGEQQ